MLLQRALRLFGTEKGLDLDIAEYSDGTDLLS